MTTRRRDETKQIIPESMMMLDEAIKARAATLQKSMGEDLRQWADTHGVDTEDELAALAKAAFLPEGQELQKAHPAIVQRITARVLDRITNIH